MNLRRSNRSAGMFLLECIVYIGVFFVLTGLAFEAFYAGWDHHKNLDRNVTDIVRTLRAGERWRADVRSATAPPELTRDGQAELVQLPRASGAVFYRFDSNTVARRQGDRPWETLLPNVKRSSFTREDRTAVEAWRWDLELVSKQKVARVAPLFSFQAVRPTTPPAP